MPHPDDPKEPKKRGRPPGFVGTSNRDIQYICDVCGKNVGKEKLCSKQVVFRRVGRGGRIIRSRIVQWVCDACVVKDPHYTQEKLTASPGMRDVKHAK
jgi:hypothetical protein